MIAVLMALAYGVAAGFVLPVTPFALGLTVCVVATIVIEFGAASVWMLAWKALGVVVFGQIGYLTAVFARGCIIDARRSKSEGGSSRAGSPSDLPEKLHVQADD